jgi:hypothetical protein
MNDTINLKEIEKKVFSSTYQDGFFDLLIGILLIAMGFSPMLEKAHPLADWWIAILTVPFIVAFVLAKKFITVPRMGTVKFSEKRRAKIKKSVSILLAFLILGIIASIVFTVGIIPYSWLSKRVQIPSILWVVASIIGFSLAAYSLNIKRYYLYGILYAIPFPFYRFLKFIPKFSHLSLIMFFISGVIIIIIGTIVLVRFLRNYPQVKEEKILTSK